MDSLLIEFGIDKTLFIEVGLFFVFYLIMRVIYFVPFFNFLTARQSRFDNWKNETEKFESEAKKKQKLYLKNIQDFESHQAKNRDEALEQFKKEQEHIVVHAKENSKKRVLDTLKLLRDQEENLALNLKAEEEKIAQLIYKKMVSGDS